MAAAVGGVALASVLPTLVIGLLGGAVADVADRRRLVLWCTAAASLVSVALTVQALPTRGGTGQLPALNPLVAIQAGLQALRAPALRTFAPALLTPSQLPPGSPSPSSRTRSASSGGQPSPGCWPRSAG